MKRPSLIALLVLTGCFLSAPGLWAGVAWSDGLFERDAQRIQRAREAHEAEIGRAFETYATRVDRANTTLQRIYEPLIDRYASRGDNATADQLRAELAERLDQALKLPFPSDEDEEESNEVADAHRDLIEAIGPQLVNARDQRAPTNRLAEYDYVMLYYTAGWCAPCRAFTPDLIQFYNENRSQGKWEIIVVSGDRSEQDFYGYLQSAGMPWAAVPFNRIQPSNLLQKYPGGYPRLIVLDRDGNQAVRASNRVAVLEQFRDRLRQ